MKSLQAFLQHCRDGVYPVAGEEPLLPAIVSKLEGYNVWMKVKIKEAAEQFLSEVYENDQRRELWEKLPAREREKTIFTYGVLWGRL